MNQNQISLVIPAYNEEKYIRPTLESVMRAKKIFEKKYKEKVEVIVVDNNSTDKTAEIAISNGCKVVTYAKHNLAAVRNAGAKAATGEYIAFVDGDSSIIPEATFINIYNNLANEKIFGGGSLLLPDKFNSFFGFFGFGLIDTLMFNFGAIFTRISAILIYLRRSDFEEFGGFDETFWALEDRDLGIKMKKMAKEKKQKIRHLRNPVIVCTRKNKLLSFSKMASLYIKILKKDAVKKEEVVHDFMYDFDKLR